MQLRRHGHRHSWAAASGNTPYRLTGRRSALRAPDPAGSAPGPGRPAQPTSTRMRGQALLS
jgi:hypothetical protein